MSTELSLPPVTISLNSEGTSTSLLPCGTSAQQADQVKSLAMYTHSIRAVHPAYLQNFDCDYLTLTLPLPHLHETVVVQHNDLLVVTKTYSK